MASREKSTLPVRGPRGLVAEMVYMHGDAAQICASLSIDASETLHVFVQHSLGPPGRERLMQKWRDPCSHAVVICYC